MYSLEIRTLIDRFHLENLTPEIDLEHKVIQNREVNRPALQLTGFYEYFDAERVQILGQVEYSYLSTLTPYKRRQVFKRLLDTKFPCLIVCRGLPLFEEDHILDYAVENGVPVLRTQSSTAEFIAELTRYLTVELAPRITMHGVLVDIYGEGVLIMGESGIGKSESALELIRRGHRLVADDVVDIKRISDEELIGTSPEVIRHFIELRGIGILDARELYGVEAIKLEQQIDLVVNLEVWDPNKQYDRLGLAAKTVNILGNQVVCYNVPMRPGRNLAIIVETAAINHRQKKMGYNAAEELGHRVMGNIEKRKYEKVQNEGDAEKS